MDVTELLEDDACQCLLHNCEIFDQNGESHNAHACIQDKVVVLYFTSNWCQPCHTFTEVLKKSYEGSEKKIEQMAVINVPLEPNSMEAEYCFKVMHPDWRRLSPESRMTKLLANKYYIRTVPRVIVCKSDGSTLSTKGRLEVETKHSLALLTWIELLHAKPKQLVHGFDIEDDENNQEKTQ